MPEQYLKLGHGGFLSCRDEGLPVHAKKSYQQMEVLSHAFLNSTFRWRITDCRRRCLFGRDHITKDQEDGQELDGRTRRTKMQEGWIRTGKKSSGIETAGGGC